MDDKLKIFDEQLLRNQVYEKLLSKAAGGSNTSIQILIKHDDAVKFENIKKEIFDL